MTTVTNLRLTKFEKIKFQLRAKTTFKTWNFNFPKILTGIVEKQHVLTPFNLTLYSYHVTRAFQTESTLNSCLNVKELLAQSRCQIWSLTDCNGTPTHNHLVCKWTLNHLAKLAKWLTCVVSIYLYGAYHCMFLSCCVRISEWIHTLYLLECQGTPCSKQAQNLTFTWGQRD